MAGSAGGINSNLQADFATRLLGLNQQQQQQALRKIASGSQIATAGDNPAGLSISERLESIERGFQQAERNLQDGASALQVAEGGLSNINDSLQRIRELTVQASNDTLTDGDRTIIQGEIDQLTSEIDRQATSTSFNGQQLLNGNFDSNNPFTLQVGADANETIEVTLDETSTTTLGVDAIDVTTSAGRAAALDNVDTAINTINGSRAGIGTSLNQIESAGQFVGVARENTLAALSGIRDADFAQETTKLALTQITAQSGLAALSQSNLTSQNILQLLA